MLFVVGFEDERDYRPGNVGDHQRLEKTRTLIFSELLEEMQHL